MEVFATLAIIFMVAFMVEAIVEVVFGTPFEKVPKLAPFKWTLMYIALVVGVLAAFHWQFDFVHLLSEYLSPEPIPVSPFGMVLTGLTIGRGASAVHDLIEKFFGK